MASSLCVKSSRILFRLHTSWSLPRPGFRARHLIGAAQSSSRPRFFHASSAVLQVKPFILADIGEGIRECEIIQWFVEPGARVEQFDKLCEVQSDKASVEITSRFDGVIKQLHYEAGEMAIVGKPLVDIDITSDISAEDEALTKTTEDNTADEAPNIDEPADKVNSESSAAEVTDTKDASDSISRHSSSKLATPAVRQLARANSISLDAVKGSGLDGRVLKEDVERVMKHSSIISPQEADKLVSLTPMQAQMFKNMTKSLSIPHFLFSDTYDFGSLSALRRHVNEHLSHAASSPIAKISYLPFVIKAISRALTEYPLLNARLETDSETSKPQLLYRAEHNIGVAVDSPAGLIVPVIKSAQNLSVVEIGSEVQRLLSLAREGRLSSKDLSGGTITVSNIGNIGGLTVSPVILEGQVAILGIGKIRVVPAFGEWGDVIRREEAVLSWSADHRVIDGATMARMAAVVGGLIENPGKLLTSMQ